MTHLKGLFQRRLSLFGMVAVLTAASGAVGAPVWYTAGTGGFIANTNDPTVAATSPTVPDFYQHQNWSPASFVNGQGQTVYTTNSSNGWESLTVAPNGGWGGWCGFTASTDSFYDLQSQGYVFKNLTDPTPANAWFTATYGAAGKPLVSNIATVAKVTNVQAYLDNNVNNAKQTDAKGNVLGRVTSQVFPVNPATGLLQYWSYSKKALVDGQKSSDTAFDFTNKMLERGEDLDYYLLPGTNTSVYNPSTQNFWWGNHVVAVSGISIKTSSVYIADPDTNGGPGAANSGWIRNSPNWPGALASAANAALPVPALNSFDNANAATFNSNYDRFQFANTKFPPVGPTQYIAPVVTSPDAAQFNNTFLAKVYVTGPSVVNKIKVSPRTGPSIIKSPGSAEEESDVTLQIPSDCSPIDGVLIEPSTPAIVPSVDPTADSLIDDTNPASTWSVADDATDPFGNSMTNGAIEYDLTGGLPLEPGDFADLDLATTADFSLSGYDVLIHFAGDDSGEWVPEMIGGTDYDPSETAAADEAPVPEPGSLGVLSLGLLGLRRRRTCEAR